MQSLSLLQSVLPPQLILVTPAGAEHTTMLSRTQGLGRSPAGFGFNCTQNVMATLVAIRNHLPPLKVRPFSCSLSKKELRCITERFVYIGSAAVKPCVSVPQMEPDASLTIHLLITAPQGAPHMASCSPAAIQVPQSETQHCRPEELSELHSQLPNRQPDSVQLYYKATLWDCKTFVDKMSRK